MEFSFAHAVEDFLVTMSPPRSVASGRVLRGISEEALNCLLDAGLDDDNACQDLILAAVALITYENSGSGVSISEAEEAARVLHAALVCERLRRKGYLELSGDPEVGSLFGEEWANRVWIPSRKLESSGKPQGAQ